MSAPDVAWTLGRPTIGVAATLASRLKVYGRDRVPPTGGAEVTERATGDRAIRPIAEVEAELRATP